MWSCLAFCFRGTPSLRKTSVESSSSMKGVVTQDRDAYILVEFSSDVDRRLVRFHPPVPQLPRCSLCGMVPSRLYGNDSCKHVFCSSCHGQSAPECPFDGAIMPAANPDTTPAAMVSECLVHCWNHTDGCTYVACLLEMPSHYRTCPHFSVSCQHCGEKVKMMDLVSHVANGCSKKLLVNFKPLAASKELQPYGAKFISSKSLVYEVPAPSRRKADYVWTVGPYSALASGIHHFKSEPFYTRSGNKIQLLGYIDVISAVELKAAVQFLPRSGGKSPVKLPRSYTFRLLRNDHQRHGSVEVTYPVEELLVPQQTSVLRLIARTDKTAFKEEFVSNDTFVVEFSASP
ncbi:unnamed protein product [Ixodes hexagonus]